MATLKAYGDILEVRWTAADYGRDQTKVTGPNDDGWSLEVGPYRIGGYKTRRDARMERDQYWPKTVAVTTGK